MPQMDRRRRVLVPIEHNPVERLEGLPQEDRISLVLITEGKCNVVLNEEPLTLCAPCALCLSDGDRLAVLDNSLLFAQSFSMAPSFLKSRLSFRQMKGKSRQMDPPGGEQDPLMLFRTRNGGYRGILSLPDEAYVRTFEWLSIMGSECAAQSDGRWTCRIRRYFLQILNLLDELYAAAGDSAEGKAPETPVDQVLEYIRLHYMEAVSLEGMSAYAHVNRTTLNRMFRQRTGQTVIDYLLSYRLTVATELLAHTGLTLDEVARASGFGYGTYLIRRFTAQTGRSPTAYRREAKAKYGIVIPPKT